MSDDFDIIHHPHPGQWQRVPRPLHRGAQAAVACARQEPRSPAQTSRSLPGQECAAPTSPAYRAFQYDRAPSNGASWWPSDRLSSYLAASANKRRRAIALYEWNSAVSAAFYVPLQTVEVALRNGSHRELAAF
jgi:hypothetical protein